jgi:uncharacterized protein (TIGR04255 family)
MGKKYKRPPIIEAFCEIQFEQNTPWIPTYPGLLYAKLQETFPEQRSAARVNVGLASAPGVINQELGLLPIVQFLQKDEQALVQVGQHLLAVNRLKPYPTWEEFLPLIVQAFQAYREVAAPTSVHRIGLRYINRIEIPGERVTLEDYFEFYPFIGEKLPQDLDAFFLGVQVSYEDARDALRLQLTTTSTEMPGARALFLDLDYFLIKPGEIALEGVPGWLDKVAHEHVEEAFEACIKDRLRDQFEEVKR